MLPGTHSDRTYVLKWGDGGSRQSKPLWSWGPHWCCARKAARCMDGNEKILLLTGLFATSDYFNPHLSSQFTARRYIFPECLAHRPAQWVLWVELSLHGRIRLDVANDRWFGFLCYYFSILYQGFVNLVWTLAGVQSSVLRLLGRIHHYTWKQQP